MKKNTLTDLNEYFWKYMFWGVIAFICYQNFVFINISGMSVLQSKLILVGSMLLVFVINIILYIHWSRKNISIVASILIPMGAYTYLTYNRYLSNLFKPVLWIACIVLLISLGFIALKKDDSISKRKAQVDRIRRNVVVIRTIVAITSMVMIGFVLGKSYIGQEFISSQECTMPTYEDEYTIANNIDTVVLLKPQNWEKIISVQERLDILECVVKIEKRYLGVNKEIQIYAKEMDNDDVYGYYSEREQAIYINKNHIMKDSVYSVLNTVCHEMYHVAEESYVEIYNSLSPEEQKLYFFYDASVYASEFSNYVSGKKEEDYAVYYEQRCEKDARAYGRDAVESYYSRISEITGDDSLQEYFGYTIRMLVEEESE